MYEEKNHVRFSECDVNGQMTFQSLVNRFQDISTAHYRDVGYTTFITRGLGYYWILLSWDIEVDRYPSVDELVTIRAYVKFRPQYFSIRSYEMLGENGEVIARATTNWGICDVKKSGLIAIPQILIDALELDEVETLPRLSLINRLEHLPFALVRSFPVEPRHLDINRHVNNVHYIRFSLDELDPAASIRKARIYYSNAAREGEMLTVSRCEVDGTIVFRTASADQEDNIKTIMQFWLN